MKPRLTQDALDRLQQVAKAQDAAGDPIVARALNALLDWHENEPRYMIVGDDSGHEYCIPDEREDAWRKFMETEAALSGDAPIWAMRLEGRFTFANPIITYNDAAKTRIFPNDD